MLRAHRLLAASMRSIKGAPGPLRATSRGMADDSDQAMVRPEDIDTRKLYRDCLRLSYHIAAESAKGDAMRTMIRSSFKANVGVKDEVEINKLKMRAILGIQNYVIHESTRKAMARRGKP